MVIKHKNNIINQNVCIRLENSPLPFEHFDPTSKPEPSGHAHRGPFGVGKQTCSQPPLLRLQEWLVSMSEVEGKRMLSVLSYNK